MLFSLIAVSVLTRGNAKSALESADIIGIVGKSRAHARVLYRSTLSQQKARIGKTLGFKIALGRGMQVRAKQSAKRADTDIMFLCKILHAVQRAKLFVDFGKNVAQEWGERFFSRFFFSEATI